MEDLNTGDFCKLVLHGKNYPCVVTGRSWYDRDVYNVLAYFEPQHAGDEVEKRLILAVREMLTKISEEEFNANIPGTFLVGGTKNWIHVES